MKNRDQTKSNFDGDARNSDERILKYVPGYLVELLWTRYHFAAFGGFKGGK
ncbi:MAG: hypothetical protein WC500_03110 [Candidatus Margulisiibacteriota bacterium]